MSYIGLSMENRILWIGLLLFFDFVYVQAQSNEEIQRQPNIILIIADDVSHDDFGCYGNMQVQTPHIDRIAKEGLRFTNMYLTTSSCSPSRISILTGRHPHNTGAPELHMPLPAGIPTFAGLLKQAGYYVAQAGKWHLGPSARADFDIVQDNVKENGEGGEDKWLSSLKERPKDRPFFMWFASYDAHREWGSNAFSGTHPPDRLHLPAYYADTPDTRRDLANYYDEIARLDFHVGTVSDELKKQGIWDNTILIVMADNGRPFPRDKTRLYDSGIKSPFIVHGGGFLKANHGRTCEALISAIDIAPTICDLAGIKTEGKFRGKSFAPLLQNTDRPFRKYSFAQHNWHDYEAMERMVVDGEYMYILNLRHNLPNTGAADVSTSSSFQDLRALRNQGSLNNYQSDIFVVPRPMEELYDLRTDPMQFNNLVSNRKYRSQLKRMKRQLKRWRKDTGDYDIENLTKDWFDRQTGEALDIQKIRGEVPGSKTVPRNSL